MSWFVGQKLNPIQKPEVSREQLKEYAVASGDLNPIHLDDSFAKEAGFASVIAHGMLSMAYLSEHILFNFPSHEFQFKRFRSRFRKPTFPGDTLVFSGEVKIIHPSGEIIVSNRAINQRNETVTEGEAVLQSLGPLPK